MAYDIQNLFLYENPSVPCHFYVCFQPESILSEHLNSPHHNAHLFQMNNLKSYIFRCGDVKFPSTIFSCEEYVEINSSDTSLSPLDKWVHASYLQSMALDHDSNKFARFSYTQYFINGAFFISVSFFHSMFLISINDIIYQQTYSFSKGFTRP